MISKTQLKQQIEHLPEQFTIEQLVDRLIFAGKVESGLQDSTNGRLISETDLETEIKKWSS